jgi:DNA-binding NarL/FixJ family response regulator
VLIESTEAYAMQQDQGGVRATLTELGRVALALTQLEIAATLLVFAHGLTAHEHDRPVHDTALAALAARLQTTPGDLVSAGSNDLGLEDVLDLARSLAMAPVPSPEDLPAGLTAREIDVLRLLAEGHSNRAIGDRLFVSDRTVENHVRHILDKLHLDSRTAAAAWAVRHDLA